ncbi:histidine kinase [Caryophanon tenue]|uniref:histidine kinase n=2 Tax=Caryophanon tenue TaxID=33978 RepID=A0A1C0Y5Q9_9BACL|nr:histidine kinase [Caryophanon tenue]
MWISFEMILNIVMTLMFGYVYLSLFTAYYIGNIKHTVGFYVMYGLHIGFTVLAIVLGFFIDIDLFLYQLPFVVLSVIGVVLLPFTLYNRNRRENLQGELTTAKNKISELIVIEERQRISRDLHDTLGQKLSMIGLKSDLAARLVEKDPARAIEEIKEIRQTASIALKEVRELVADMRAVKLQDEVVRIRQMLSAAEIELMLDANFEENKATLFVESVLSMCLKEAVNNIVKHSGATMCHITYHETNDEIILRVQDNGHGYTEEATLKGGSGLKGMRERLEFINGTVQLSQQNGTIVHIRVPIAITRQKRK